MSGIGCLPAHSAPRGWTLLVAVAFLTFGYSGANAITADCLHPEQAATREPPNLGQLDLELKSYHSSGAYDRDVTDVLEKASNYVQQRASINKSKSEEKRERFALVLDIDETSLSNWPEMIANDFGFIKGGGCPLTNNQPCGFDAWIGLHMAPAIRPTLNLFNAAKADGVEIFFISSRPEEQREATVENLEGVGYRGWKKLILKPRNDSSPVQAFKTAGRRKIEEDGYKIIANVGDQLSDLCGGHAEKAFKVPNPFYLIPGDRSDH
jgi:acid phosphatase